MIYIYYILLFLVLTLVHQGRSQEDFMPNCTDVSSSSSSSNFCTSDQLEVGWVSPTFYRIYLDWPSLPENITVQSATLSLYCYNRFGDSSPVLMVIPDPSEQWNSCTVTWDNQPIGEPGDWYDFEQFVAFGSENEWHSHTSEWLRGWVQQWVDGQTQIAGLALVMLQPADARAFQYRSDNFFDTSLRPKLTLQYVTAVDELVASQPTEFALSQNFPNPFNPSTSIQFSLPIQSEVRISVFDVFGSQISELVNGKLQEGSYQTKWDGKNFSGKPVASGTYIYRVVAEPTYGNGLFVRTRKMLLVR